MVSLTKANADDLSALQAMVGWYAVELKRFYEPGVRPPVLTADSFLNRAQPGCFIVRQDGVVAGFAVMAVRPAIPGVCGNYFGEFYVKPEFRNGSTAMQAASQLVRSYPGEWTADCLIRNGRSNGFIERMAQRVSGSCQRRIIQDTGWQAMRYRFTVGGN